ncbi:meiosis-specific with OB domain-containing protein isoform X2 [Syngnathus scovelli]|uniref:meiosis-specific with OB domain-containing protein isoform X2 n=1 Tax=Syngnathus scovelli TaxID=161590 RepID=UPI00210FE957|nr:meiosis-specific with OB domain-containing protein isoform X2 [Syngnathus scovelli]
MAAMNYNWISDLNPKLSNTMVIGIIIGKTDIKHSPARKVKDSPDFFINVLVLGSDSFINTMSNSYNIGDVVTIENALVAIKDSEKEERFCPTTPSPYRLILSEFHSQVHHCVDMHTKDRLLPLIHIPVKDSKDFYNLGDIQASGNNLEGSFINILAAVKGIGEMKLFQKSDGCPGQRMEVKLFDGFVSSFSLLCWDREAIKQVQTSVCKGTVIFIADAKITFDSFRNGMTATVNSKTIITVSPDMQEADLLYRYAAEMLESGALEQDDMPLESISAVYTVAQLKGKIQESPETVYGITISFITGFDLDSSVSKVIKTRCTNCKFQVTEGMQYCSNQLCPGKGQVFSSTTGFDLLMDLSDRTGTLQCNLRSPVADAMLGCTTEQFTCLTENDRSALKWKFLLETCKAYVKMFRSTRTKSGFRAVILSCSLVDTDEATQHTSALLNED